MLALWIAHCAAKCTTFALNFGSFYFPGNSDSKETACNVGDLGLIPGLGRSPGDWNGYPLQYSYLENSMDRGAWQLQPMGFQRVGQDWATFTLGAFSNFEFDSYFSIQSSQNRIAALLHGGHLRISSLVHFLSTWIIYKETDKWFHLACRLCSGNTPLVPWIRYILEEMYNDLGIY